VAFLGARLGEHRRRAGAARARLDEPPARDFDGDRIAHDPASAVERAAVRNAAIDSLYKARRRDSSAQEGPQLRDVNGLAPRLK